MLDRGEAPQVVPCRGKVSCLTVGSRDGMWGMLPCGCWNLSHCFYNLELRRSSSNLYNDVCFSAEGDRYRRSKTYSPAVGDRGFEGILSKPWDGRFADSIPSDTGSQQKVRRPKLLMLQGRWMTESFSYTTYLGIESGGNNLKGGSGA